MYFPRDVDVLEKGRECPVAGNSSRDDSGLDERGRLEKVSHADPHGRAALADGTAMAMPPTIIEATAPMMIALERRAADLRITQPSWRFPGAMSKNGARVAGHVMTVTESESCVNRRHKSSS
jgi:hypothetical protein